MNFITGLVGTTVMGGFVVFTWVTPTPTHAMLMLVMGAAGMGGHLVLIKAFQQATPAMLAPFTYGQIAWAVLLGYLIFGAIPDLGSLIGMAIIAGCGLYIAYHRAQSR
jgi:drug/metabolite transporter (DMT)-like permease